MTKGWQATLYTTEMEHSGHERDGHRMGAHTVACDAASGVGSAEEGRTRWLDHGARRSRRRWRYRESGIEWALTILAVRSECLHRQHANTGQSSGWPHRSLSSIAAGHRGMGLDHSNEPSSSVEAAFSRQPAAEPGQLMQLHLISLPDACQTASSYRANTSVRS
jgi:hypothetical protein